MRRRYSFMVKEEQINIACSPDTKALFDRLIKQEKERAWKNDGERITRKAAFARLVRRLKT